MQMIKFSSEVYDLLQMCSPPACAEASNEELRLVDCSVEGCRCSASQSRHAAPMGARGCSPQTDAAPMSLRA